MSFSVRDGKFDVVIVAGPGIPVWPSAGMRSLSALCAEMGLTVGMLGGDTLTARGVIPLFSTGGLVLAEDLQNRIHRIHARSVVRVVSPTTLPDPFPGWRSPGLIPLSTAQRLKSEARVTWDPATVILGSGNRALKFGSQLLDDGVREVFCVEQYAQWGAKRFAGWEVERRNFEMNGGKLLEAKPIKLTPKAALLYEFKLEDAQGIRMLDVARVVAAGPFHGWPGVREYPPGSFLFEMESTAAATRSDDVEGWVLEEERGRWLGGKIVRALATDLGDRKEELDRVYRRARSRLKRYVKHQEEAFSAAYQGKWIAAADMNKLRSFEGVPKQVYRYRAVASVECMEDIPCNLCESACPESAIEISRSKGSFLIEADCTACGLCLSACPSSTPVLIHEKEDRSLSQLTLGWGGIQPWQAGDSAVLLNRRGESLGSGRVTGILAGPPGKQLVQVEVPTHLIWEARGLRRGKEKPELEDVMMISAAAAVGEDNVEITLNGDKRLVKDRHTILAALFEIGQARAEDVLYCPDGSCGLCHVLVDGVKKPACKTTLHRGMAIRFIESGMSSQRENALCPCLGVSPEEVIGRMQHGKLQSPDAVLSATHVGEGKCHGRLCMDAFRRILTEQGLDVTQWIDWRFPWSDWVLKPGPESSRF